MASQRPSRRRKRGFRLRWVFFGLAGLLVLAVALVGAVYLWLSTSLPEYDGGVTVAGLDAPVEIVRDAHAIPHIYADTTRDAAFAMGYVHAQDRLWQMEYQRRIGAGRLSEVFGARAVEFDKFLRTLGLYAVAERNFERFTPDAKALYEAYAAGVNAYLETRSGVLPPEFILLGHEPEPWRPADSVVWLKMMAWDLSANFQDELLRARLATRLDAAQIADLWPPYPSDAPTGMGSANEAAAIEPSLGAERLDALARVVPSTPPTGLGSNNWVLSGAHTESGKPLLANDPHLGLSMPALWYLAHIVTPELTLIGATLPGLPFPILGRSDDFAWGFTNTAPDVQDLFIERIDADDPARYLTPGGSEPFEIRDEVIRVKRGAEFTLTVRETRHGPVISDLVPAREEFLEADTVLAFSWTALADDDLTAQALAHAPAAKDWDGFVDALRDMHAPQQNIVFADRFGNIGLVAPARVPIRAKGDGGAPVPGWTGEHDWVDTVPFAALPRLFNPSAGRIVTANNKVVGPDYPYFITHDWAPPYRAERIGILLGERAKHTVESFTAIQQDQVSLAAATLLPMLTKMARPETPAARAALERLAGWDHVMTADGIAPLIYAAWARELMVALFRDELGTAFEDYWSIRADVIRLALTERTAWCDDVLTPDSEESCADAVSRALERCVTFLTVRYGSRMDDWRWGEAHFAWMRHRVLSEVPQIGGWFEVRLPNGGEKDTVNAGGFVVSDPTNPFAQIHGPGYRAVYDLAAPERSVFIQSSGQSGNPFSDHYADFAGLWQAGRYVSMLIERDRIADGALGTLTLSPP